MGIMTASPRWPITADSTALLISTGYSRASPANLPVTTLRAISRMWSSALSWHDLEFLFQTEIRSAAAYPNLEFSRLYGPFHIFIQEGQIIRMQRKMQGL